MTGTPWTIVIAPRLLGRARAVEAVLAERERQDAKYGRQDLPDGTGPHTRPLAAVDAYCPDDLGVTSALVLANQARLARDEGRGAWKDLLLEEVFEALAAGTAEGLRAELAQVAAVAVQWVEALDRAGGGVVSPKRIQRSRAKGWRMPGGAVYVGRPCHADTLLELANGAAP